MPVPGAVLRSHLRLLELTSVLSEQEAERIFGDLSTALQSEKAVTVLLACCPESKQGLFPVAAALLHPAQTIRFYACLILQRLENHDVTRPAVEGLNRFLATAHRRVIHEMTAAA